VKIERFAAAICTKCGITSIIFRLDRNVKSANILAFLVKEGFRELNHMTAAGIMYAEDQNIIVSGPFTSNQLTIRCKIKQCSDKIDELERLLTKLE
jgi:hypothetical protein